MSLVFLAFDLEMLLYPGGVIVVEVGASAVLEMFGFLALPAGVVCAWREGAFRWA